MNQIEKDYSEYNYWANKRLANWMENIPINIIISQVKSSYPSIYFTIYHLITTEGYWLSKILDTKYELPQIKEEASIFREFVHQSRMFNEVIQQFGKDDFKREVEMDIKAKGIQLKGKYSVTELIHHCMNHSTYHRGQIVTNFFIFKMNKQVDSNKISI